MEIGIYSRPLRPHRSSFGFTLIEILVVLVIIGIVVGAVSLNLIHRNHSGFSSKSAVNLLRTKMLLAEQQSLILNQTIGLSLSQKGYQFLNYTGAGTKAYWTEIDTPSLKKQKWPLNTSVTLELENAKTGEALPADFSPIPQIVISSSGNIAPFKLYINERYILTGTEANDIVITTQ